MEKEDKDLKWLNEKYPGNNFKTRKDWYILKIHMKKGATLRQNQPIEKVNVRAKKKTDNGSTDMNNKEEDMYDKEPVINDRKKFIPPRKDMETIFDFDYNDMLSCEPNKKFNKVKSLVFNHVFDDIRKQEQYERFTYIYHSLSDEQLNKIDDIYKRLSTYIRINKLNKKFVDGSIICNIALMIRKYIDTGEFDTSINFYNKISDENYMDELNQFHLFLIRNCFIAKNQYFYKYINDEPIKNWWACCHLFHRLSDKDMQTKNLCEPFRNELGKIIYKIY